MRASMRPAPLHSLRNRRPRSSSADSPVSPLIVDPFANFDTEINVTPNRQTPLSPDFQVIIAQQSNYRHSVNDGTPPIPPLKDDFAYWSPKVPSPALTEAPLLSSKSFKPPRPRSAWSESTTRDSNRLSYYQDTPTTPKALPQTPKSPLTPQRSRATRAQTPGPPPHSPRTQGNVPPTKAKTGNAKAPRSKSQRPCARHQAYHLIFLLHRLLFQKIHNNCISRNEVVASIPRMRDTRCRRLSLRLG